jgi:hypothetical protein
MMRFADLLGVLRGARGRGLSGPSGSWTRNRGRTNGTADSGRIWTRAGWQTRAR